jgi:hypothetical protein
MTLISNADMMKKLLVCGEFRTGRRGPITKDWTDQFANWRLRLVCAPPRINDGPARRWNKSRVWGISGSEN